MAVPEQIDRDAACESQITLASIADQIGALTANRTHPAPGIDGHQPRDRHGTAPFPATKGQRRPHRSEEISAGTEGVSSCRSRWSPYHEKKHIASRMNNPRPMSWLEFSNRIMHHK